MIAIALLFAVLAGGVILLSIAGWLAGHSSERRDADAFMKFDRDRDLRR